MNICMMTNTYLPHVGGVARSVSTFAEEYLREGHEVLVVAPEFPGRPPPAKSEAIVERVAAIQNFNGSDFSVRLPLAAMLAKRLDAFKADIIHAHHPFLLGDTALRVAANKNVPIVFTHHTRYEDYTHYLPFASKALREIAITLPTQFANFCDGVIAPSESIARLIKSRGVKVPVAVVPTGIDVEAFASADGAACRTRLGIPPRAFVAGYVGRLAAEKNLGFLAEAAALFVKQVRSARFLVVGAGPAADELKQAFERHEVSHRLVMAGKQTGRALREAYRAMDVFAFASQTETQGMVLEEAMAAGLPVVALNAPGVREVMHHNRNGYLLPAAASPVRFADHLVRIAANSERRAAFAVDAHATAENFSRARCAAQALEFYTEIRKATRSRRISHRLNPWENYLQRLTVEWELLVAKTHAVAAAVFSDKARKAS